MTGRTCFGSATSNPAQHFTQEKKDLQNISGKLWEAQGLMVSVLVSGLSGLCLSPGGDIVFSVLGQETLLSQASLRPGV